MAEQILGEFSLTLPRNAFSPREAARAADLWRACQDVAVWESTRVGWPPTRYRDEGTSFIVRSMTAQHHRETHYGEPLHALTWVSRLRREMFSTREVRIDAGGEPVCSATQEWVHVAADLTPSRAPATLASAFPIVTGRAESITLPAITEPISEARVHELRFRCWHLWMDPLAHVNHPMYVDFADEALACAMARAGLSPASLVPVAETATFRAGVGADVEVRVESRVTGMTAAGDVVVAHRVLGTNDLLCATLTTVRRLAGAPSEVLLAALR
jgi:acyl-CoA thioesterase FadM